jgi:transcriptional regulator with XRE-family HTH domain
VRHRVEFSFRGFRAFRKNLSRGLIDFFAFLIRPGCYTVYGYTVNGFQEGLQVPFTISLEMPAKKPPKTSFGQRLFALRKARGLTQVDLAKALGTTQRVISYYETGAPLPSASFLVTLAHTLRVTTDELLGAKPAKLASASPEKHGRLWKRFQRMESLPERDQRAVLRLINSLVASSGNGHARSSAHP